MKNYTQSEKDPDDTKLDDQPPSNHQSPESSCLYSNQYANINQTLSRKGVGSGKVNVTKIFNFRN